MTTLAMKNPTVVALRKLALRHPDAEEGVACEVTAVEKRTVKAGKKAFVFLGVSDVMLKLAESLPEARRLASKDPSYRVGANGWVKATFGDGASPPLDLLAKWIDESHRLAAGGAEKKTTPKPAKKKPAPSKARSRG